jgi:Domain of unknown function (DUF4136)
MAVRSSYVIAALCALLLAGCETTPKVGVDYNPQYVFAGKTRFAVVRPTGPGMNDLMVQRLGGAIESALAARGYRIVPAAQADMLVSFFVTSQNKADVHTYNTGFAYRRCWDPLRCAGWASPEVDVRYYTEGTLLIDFIDPASKTLEWRGTTSKRLASKPSPSERDELAKEVVDAIIAQYPPGAAAGN